MDVTFTDRGFEVEVVGGLPGGLSGCLRPLLPMALLFQLLLSFMCLGATLENDLDMGLACLLAGVSGVVGLVMLAAWRYVNVPTKGRLALDGDTLTFTSTDGEVRMQLSEINGVDVIPVGLAIRPKRGMTHHVMMVETSEPARQWLDEAIEAARKKFGTKGDVPRELDALKPR
jgi:hypothetical protein